MAIDNKIQGNRLQFVDISKGISITVIVMLHISSSIFPEAVRSLVGSYWHVPVFFILAGFFIKEDKLLAPKQFVISKVKTLYLPATYIYLLAVICHNLFVKIGWYPLGEFHPANKIPYEMWSLRDYAINIIKTIFCAGQEQIMGAMWFLYTLLFAICFISLLSFCLRRVIHDKMKYEWMRAIVLFVLQIINVISFNKYSISIPRVSNLFTFSFLIYLGMLMFQKKKIEFNNTWVALICFLVLLQACFLRKESGVLYNPGACVDVLQYDVVCICALYVVAYVSLLLSNIKWGGVIAHIGRESFYIMALHPVGYHICSNIIVYLGLMNTDASKGIYTYHVGHSVTLWLMYTLFAIIVPIVLINTFRWTKKILIGK